MKRTLKLDAVELKARRDQANINMRAMGAGLSKIISDNECEPDELPFVDELFNRWRELVTDRFTANEAYYSLFRQRRRARVRKPRAKKKAA